MNKKFNTILFLLGASAFHIVSFFLLLFAIYVPIVLAFPRFTNNASIGPIIMIAAIVAAFVLAVLVYRGVLRLVQKKIDLDKYLDPIFGKGKDKLR
jgi:hypothetical protein